MIRDVAASYRRALAETVRHYSGWLPDAATVDGLKAEGRWNNDWDASLELLRRHGQDPLPDRDSLIGVFSGFYFGGDPLGDPLQWTGFIGHEPLLVEPVLFEQLDRADVAWGFVSGAEPPSARYVLEERLGLADPPLVAMGDAPDKPDPTGLLRLARQLAGTELGTGSSPPVAYLGDTVADVLTVVGARQVQPQQTFLALAVAPPHLHGSSLARRRYEDSLRKSGADAVISSTGSVLESLERLLAPSRLIAPSPRGS
ncbi:TIGR01548 family HAD-type hydrolase [Cyanobium sp. NIES-981]|uniref:TIGR01548 family HAD-type hydrolase n=1 Tax=Cyanobium sp. NIES-981 TaxID=1851505 RepID=UPI0007DD985A|nr:TIGR01548 family HAD-type hydrolase [Cyanobium sp. NIES-981]SBO44524.1 HAD superfamily (Subfamily IA) hydrolase [Cyanobium sp. NIES-981]